MKTEWTLILFAASLPGALLQPVPAHAGEPEPICARAQVIEFVAGEIHRRSPYAKMLTETIGEQPGGTPSVVRCAVSVVQRDFDYVKYRTQTWTETQSYTVRWLDPGYEVTLHDPVRQ